MTKSVLKNHNAYSGERDGWTIPTHTQYERNNMMFSSSRQQASLEGIKKIYETKCFVKVHDEVTRTLVKTGPEFLNDAAVLGLPVLISSFPSHDNWGKLPLSKHKWIHSATVLRFSFYEGREHPGNYHQLKFHIPIVNMDWIENLAHCSLIVPWF